MILTGPPESQWDSGTRDYVDHLVRCEEFFDPDRVVRVPADLPLTKELFEDVQNYLMRVDRLLGNIVAVRRAHHQGKTEEEIRRMLTEPEFEVADVITERENWWILALPGPSTLLSDAGRRHIAEQIIGGATHGEIVPGPDGTERPPAADAGG